MINMRELVKANEQVIWEGRPKMATTVLEGIFNPMLPFAIVWGLFDTFILASFFHDSNNGIAWFVLLFMAVHMITTNGLYVSGGVFAFNYEMKPWTDIGHITVHQGIFDRMFGVGDVVFVCSHTHSGSHDSGGHMSIRNIPDFKEVFKMVNNLQTDIFSDTMYPNAMRPDTNPGYNTQYTGLDKW